MRINYYEFPEGTPENVLLKNGCAVILKSGREIYPDSIPDDKRPLVDRIDRVLGGISITTAKNLMKQYGGIGWTDHCERDGSVFETSEITLKGNNSRFKYNHHL